MTRTQAPDGTITIACEDIATCNKWANTQGARAAHNFAMLLQRHDYENNGVHHNTARHSNAAYNCCTRCGTYTPRTQLMATGPHNLLQCRNKTECRHRRGNYLLAADMIIPNSGGRPHHIYRRDMHSHEGDGTRTCFFCATTRDCFEHKHHKGIYFCTDPDACGDDLTQQHQSTGDYPPANIDPEDIAYCDICNATIHTTNADPFTDELDERRYRCHDRQKCSERHDRRPRP